MNYKKNMKLRKLKGIAYNAIHKGSWYGLFSSFSPPCEITIDLVTGKLTPDRKGDDVEKFYKRISEWFQESLTKEGIPIDIIEEATIKIASKRKKCIIKANGKTFTSETKL